MTEKELTVLMVIVGIISTILGFILAQKTF